MEIKATGTVGTSAVRRKSPASTGGGGFAVSDAPETHAHIVSGPGPIAALDSILALQDMGDPSDGRSKGLAHGEQLLDILDAVRDGMLAGLNLEQTLGLAANISTPVIASGGVGDLDDIRALKAAATAATAGRIDGVIVGRALYDGRVDPAEALALLAD